MDFSIANVIVRLQTEQELPVTDAFQKFLLPCDEKRIPDYIVQFRAVSSLSKISGECIYEEGRFCIYCLSENSYLRVFRKETCGREVYAMSMLETGNHQVQVQYLETERKEFCDTQKAFLHIGWEWMLAEQKKIMLHASFVKTPYGGLLFSGPSGIGKSTRANLWCRYGEGKLINGDKTILDPESKGWIGYGSPYAGSSGCYVNDKCQIRAVFFLKRGEGCSLKPLSIVESFKRLYTGLTINHWDRNYVDTVSQLAYQMAVEVPMYEFVSPPDQNAVEYLKVKLLEGGEMVE